jgi:hypothetical protein
MILKTTISGNFKERGITILLILWLVYLPLFSQSISTINLKNVPQRKVREYIEIRSFDRLNDFSSIHASWKSNIGENDFKAIEETFYLKKELSVVWDCYRHTNPLKMWNGRSFRFGLLICKCSKSVIYAHNSNVPALDTGQVYFINLRLIKGLVNVPVAFEIINIDDEKKIMEFSYIDKNISRGKQILEFYDDGVDRTRIVHRTYFKSESWIRDDLFYPYFHNKFIEEFHRNMRQIIKNEKPTEVI